MMTEQDIIDLGKSVLDTEAKGLVALHDDLGADFVSAVTYILNTTGHVVVVGIGKSGHVGRKISASFASTGTPSFFLHPSEAAHGDLGMVTAGATILALSFSGESSEVNNVADYAAGLGNIVISMTGSGQSTLAQKSNVSLVLPNMPEACPNNLAPTTSTTSTLALGDALCVAVMSARGFTAEDFGLRHPAGKLGFGLKRVSQYLDEHPENVPMIDHTAPMSDIIVAMTSGGKGCVGILKNKALIGIVTDGDLRRAMSPNIMNLQASDIMSTNPFTLAPDMRIKDVIAAFTERKIGNAFVLDGQEIIGLIDLKTLLATGYV